MDASPTQAAPDQRWWREPFAVFQSNLQEIDAPMDVEAALDVIENHGATAWLLNTGGILANHPSDLPFQTRNPYLAGRASGDLIGDAVEAAHRRGIRLLSRFDLSKVTESIAQEHPEWLFRNHEGEPQVYQGLWSVCPSGAYYQERAFEIVDEVLDRYDVDGVFFNWFNFNMVDYDRKWCGVCHCDACVEGYKAWADGDKLPVDPRKPEIATWSAFSQMVLADLNRRITAHIHERHPNVLVVLGKQADMRYAEQGKMFGKELWPHAAGEDVSELQSHEPPIPAFVNAVSFIDMPYRMGGEEPAHFTQYLAQGMARGGMPSTYIMGTPGRIPYPSLEVAGELTRFFRRHLDLYRDLRPAARIALVKPKPHRMGAPAPDEYLGLYTLLQRAGRPFDVVPADQLPALQTAGRLSQYAAVVLPDIGSLGETAAALDAFVAAGGHLISTGSSGLDADGNAELTLSPLVSRSGPVRSGQDLWSSYATPTHQTDAAAHTYQGPLVAVFGSAYDAAWSPDAAAVGEILPPAPHGPPEKAYGHAPSPENPAYGRRRAPEGGSVTAFPWTVGTSYREVETSPAQGLFLQALDDVAPLPWRVDAPEQVEVIAGTSGDDLVIHLINLTGASRRGFRPPSPVPGIRVQLPSEAAGLTVESLMVERSSTIDENGTVAFDAIHDVEVIRIKGAATFA